ncbi:MAG TPA: hypothetical protein VI229_00245 [Burkholderiales bacterium]
MSTTLTQLAVDAGLLGMAGKVETVRLASSMPEPGAFVELSHPDYAAWRVTPLDWRVGEGRAVLERRVTFRSPPGEVVGWYALDANGALVAYDQWETPMRSTDLGGDLNVIVAFGLKG